MHLINLIVNYLYRKYGVPLHNFFENWTRGTSHLNAIFWNQILLFPDGSVTDFQKYKAKRALLGAVTGQGGAAAAGGGAAGGGGAGPGGILGRLAMGKLAAFSGGGMDPLTAYKMFGEKDHCFVIFQFMCILYIDMLQE